MALATTAQAELTEPPPLDPQNPKATADHLQDIPAENPETVPDTDQTPDVKTVDQAPPEDRWTQAAGAGFPLDADDDPRKLITDSVTTYDDNLYDASFSGTDLGLAGGATCENPNPDAEAGCRPAAFLFTRTVEGGARWQRIDLPNDGNRPGFVGAISWLDPETAMAVGGTGTYPRRELPYGLRDEDGTPCDPPTRGTKPWGWNCDQAGKARAWLYRHGVGWCELGHSDGCPSLPTDREGSVGHGLTAVEFRQFPSGRILGFVGGLGQIWRWDQEPDSAGSWTDYWDNASPPDQLVQQSVAGIPFRNVTSRTFRFRVRDIGIAAIDRDFAFAVTSGCCSPSNTTNRPVVLSYTNFGVNGSPRAPRWFAEQARPNSAPPVGLTISPDADPNAPANTANDALQDDVVPTVGPPPVHQSGAGAPDSFYSLSVRTVENSVSTTVWGSLLATSGSRDSAVEPRSEIHQCWNLRGTGPEPGRNRPPNTVSVVGPSDSHASPLKPALSTARLLSIDGAVKADGCVGASAADWAAGELRSSEVSAHGRRGLLVATRTDGRNNAPANTAPTAEEIASGSYEPTTEQQLRGHLRTHEYLTPSYTLNSLELSGAGEGWAVGDHGAIMRLGGDAGERVSVGVEPVPPRLGAARPSRLQDPAGFGSVSAASRPGVVPARSEMPRARLEHPRFVNEGSPDATHNPESDAEVEDVAQIAMSRDGTEGWAVGANTDQEPVASEGQERSEGTASLYHYDGSSWTRCDPLGIKNQLEADPDCRAVAPLRRWIDPQNTARTTRLHAIARVPLEHDPYPSNDDEFEAVAIGTFFGAHPRHGGEGDPVILRYRDGRWDFEDPQAREEVVTAGPHPSNFYPRDVAFTAPDDGWILARDEGSGSGIAGAPIHALFHYDGEEWERCELDAPDGGAVFTPGSECGSERIPQSREAARLRMTAAGGRVYLFGARMTGDLAIGPVQTAIGSGAPLLLHHDRGEAGWSAAEGLDPAFETDQPELTGTIRSLSVTEGSRGGFSGWAVGRFFRSAPAPEVVGVSQDGDRVVRPTALLLRLVEGGGWELFRDPGALEDYLMPQLQANADRVLTEPHQQVSFVDSAGEPRSFMSQWEWGRLYGFDPARERWDIVPSDRPPSYQSSQTREPRPHGVFQALAPDNQGGFWAATKNRLNSTGFGDALDGQVFFYHYTTSPPEDVFEEVPHPFSDRAVELTGLAGASDGTVWLTTNSSLLARYDRVTGWQTVQIPGWDPGRVVTRSSEVNAIAVNDSGVGVAVGQQGRIANLTPETVQLDDAASVLCEGSGIGPGCGTTRELRAVSVAPDGSALAGGDSMALLWRPPGGPFQRLPAPPGGSSTAITGISLPSSSEAWIATDTGFVFKGTMAGAGQWSWRQENRVGAVTLGAISKDFNLRLNDIEISASGHGYAVGEKGLVLERTGAGSQPWRRLRGPGTDTLTSVSLARGSDQALIGGVSGVVWTARAAGVEVARPTDYFDNDAGLSGGKPWTGPVVGSAILPGAADGEVEAWVGIQAQGGVGTNRLLHYASDPKEPLTNPAHRSDAISDSSPGREGELSFAAFGKSDCDSTTEICSEMIGSGERTEEIAREIADDLAIQSATGDGPQFALFTGDASDSAGLAGTSAVDADEVGNPFVVGTAAAGNGAFRHRRYSEFVADPLSDAGIPFLGAPGAGDLARPYACTYPGITSATDKCHELSGEAKAGENLAFREGFSGQAAPFGSGGAASRSGLELEAAPGQDDRAQDIEPVSADPDGDGELAQEVRTLDGARTHYAAEIVRDGEPVARLIALDSSHRSLAATDATQDPVETDGQLGWLERMLCFRGQSAPGGGECTREPNLPAIVLSNTPTYTYASVSPTGLAPDAAVLESLYLRYEVSAVISGRLGWNGLYYALRPGLHAPCPGEAYPEHAPDPGAALCESVASLPGAGGAPNPEGSAKDQTGIDVSEITDGAAGGEEGIVPFVVASGAGGKFGPDGQAQGSASDGFWHGYSIVRVPADGDPRGVIVEQRPLLDWVAIEANDHSLHPRERLRLAGVGREPIGFSWSERIPVTRYDEITSQAITHRYDLLLADPEDPWLACREDDPGCERLAAGLEGSAQDDAEPNPCSPYLCLPKRIGAIDRTTGQTRAGDGRYPDTLAIAMLSVGEKVATYPLLFEHAPSFVVKGTLKSVGAPPTSNAPTPRPPGQPPIPDVPQIPKIEVPAPPAPSAIPSLSAAGPPELQPPAPPAPPPPSQQPAPLDLSVAPPGVSISTPTALIQPPTPPVNPAPPGGARKEARQRQAAAQKGGADGDSPSGEGTQEGSDGDLAQGPSSPHGAAMTRLDAASPARAGHRNHYAFTRLEHSGGTPALAWGAGLTLAALALALSFATLRPGPRRRPPVVPAPSFSSVRRNQRKG